MRPEHREPRSARISEPLWQAPLEDTSGHARLRRSWNGTGTTVPARRRKWKRAKKRLPRELVGWGQSALDDPTSRQSRPIHGFQDDHRAAGTEHDPQSVNRTGSDSTATASGG